MARSVSMVCAAVKGRVLASRGAGVVAGVGLVQLDDVAVLENPGEGSPALFPREEPGGGVGRALDEVGVVEDRLVFGEQIRDIREFPGDAEPVFLAEFELPAGHGLHEPGDVFDVLGGLADPVLVAMLGVDPVFLGVAGQALDRAVERAVALEAHAEAGGGVVDLDVALRPLLHQIPRRAPDPGVLPLVSVDFHLDAEAVAQEPGEFRPGRWRPPPSATRTAGVRGAPATCRRGGPWRG